MANSAVNVFTTAMRTEFINAFQVTADPAPWEKFTQVIPSTARIENYAWMSPTPGIAQYKGHRRFGKISEVKYKIENLEYDASFEVLLRDIEDDQVGGYQSKPLELAQKAKLWPGKLSMLKLASAATDLCFDGSAFFADSHTIGTGDNLMTANVAASGGETNKLIVLVHGGALKPMVYQDRKAPRFETDADTAESLKAKVVRYWIDMEGACGYGHWWDAIQMTITDLPTAAELQDLLGLIETRFTTFQLPTALSGDQSEYVHEQLEHSTENTTCICTPGIAVTLRQVLNQTSIVSSGGAAIDNPYKGWANMVKTNLIA